VAEPLSDLRALLGARLVEDPAVLAENATDFGRLLQAKPRAVARPADAAEVAAVVRWARGAKVPLVTRGKGHSQSGLSLAEGAVVLDLSGIAAVGRPDPSTGDMSVGGGALWRDVAAAAAAVGRTPPVLTNNLGVTVGGTLSVAGLGISSFRFGCQGDQVAEMEVVTGAGEVLVCSAEKERELFDAVRSGLGLCGVVTRAVLRTVPALPQVRTYYLLYDDLPSFLKDARLLMTEERFGWLEAWCVPCPQGFRKVDGVPTPFAQWFFPLHASVEFRPGETPDDRKMLAGLGYYRQVHCEDRSALEFAGRLEPLFELWKRGGYWAAAHPWMEAILPWESAASYITGVLAGLPPHVLGGGHILLWPSKGTTSTVPLFMRPKGEFVMGFGILPGLPPAAMAVAGPMLRRASDLALKMGAKRYPSGWIEFDAARWKAHFGDRWAGLAAAKKRFDPDGILHPGLVPLEP
jgi:FAD/FMN-containing dehydrogenase